MKRFDLLLEEDVKGYDGENSELIREAPAFYRLMTRLLGDASLPAGLSQLVIAAIAYFIMPADVIPEEDLGPVGYMDDIFLCALVASQVMKEAGSADILVRNWDGQRPVAALIEEILARERELIADKKASILQYIGYDQLHVARADFTD
jgi:uncharacterized membrane protein YkvA (DUF1232 family)